MKLINDNIIFIWKIEKTKGKKLYFSDKSNLLMYKYIFLIKI